MERCSVTSRATPKMPETVPSPEKTDALKEPRICLPLTARKTRSKLVIEPSASVVSIAVTACCGSVK